MIIKKIEVSNSLFVTFNTSTDEMRICFLEAKVNTAEEGHGIGFVDSAFRHELLNGKMDVFNLPEGNYPTNILSFTEYMTITGYGVFTLKDSELTNFTFTVPQNITYSEAKKNTQMKFEMHSDFKKCEVCPCEKGAMLLDLRQSTNIFILIY